MTKIKKMCGKMFVFLPTVVLASVPSFVLAQSEMPWDVSRLSGTGLPSNTIYNIVTNILSWILGIFGFIGIIGFVISGIIYLTSAGDDNRAETAKKAMQYSILGLIVGLSGLVAIAAIDTMLNAKGYL
jgi:hypothetical protein